MDIEEIKKWIQLFKASGLSKLSVKDGDLEISMEAQGKAEDKVSTTAEGLKEIADIDLTNVITAPMVGTFYRSSDPKSPPFVEPGDIVKSGDVLCIIEAMKVMNEIKAERSGRIKEVIPTDGAPVDFAKPIFVME